jgi:hypothetical protein
MRKKKIIRVLKKEQKRNRPYLRRREEIVFMCCLANQFFLGSINDCKNDAIFGRSVSLSLSLTFSGACLRLVCLAILLFFSSISFHGLFWKNRVVWWRYFRTNI